MNPADANFPIRIWSEGLLRGFLTAIWGIKIAGLENVPLQGPFILAPNHASFLDPLLLAIVSAPRRRPYGIGKKSLFDNPLIGWWVKGVGSIPLDRRGDATSAMKAALEVLERGGGLQLYPEGRRLKPGEKREPKPGVAFLSARASAPVVPVRLLGTGEFPFKFPLEVRIGEPIAPPSSEDREAGLTYAKMVMERIYSL